MLYTVVSQETTSVCYLLAEGGGALLVDPNEGDAIQALLREKGLRPEKILLTHEHLDHISALEAVRSLYRIPVLCQEAAGRGIQTPEGNLSAIYDLLVYAQSGLISPVRHRPFVCRAPEETFTERASFSWRGHRLSLVSCPGHSPGSCLIFLDEDTVFTGDYCIRGQEPNLTLPGGDAAAYEAKALPLLQRLSPGVLLCPGHGERYRLPG